MSGVEKPLVSILMPVYNSCGTDRFSGKQLLPEALTILTGQTYQNIEVLILDNQSNDATPEVCQEFVQKDTRVKYIRDTEQRYVEGAITHLATFAQGKYCFVANDDDRWDSKFVETLVGYMEAHESVDLCYPDCHFIDLNNQVISQSLSASEYVYTEHDSPLYNFSKYIVRRNVLPLAFGIFKTSVFKQVLPYVKFDTNNANVDNLFVSKFFLSGFNAHRVPETLFFYRFRYRPLPKEIRNDPEVKNEFYLWIYAIRHQLLFYKELRSLIDGVKTEDHVRASLYLSTLLSCITFAIDSADETRYHTVTNNADKKKFIEARKKYYGLLKRALHAHIHGGTYYTRLKRIHTGDRAALQEEADFCASVITSFGAMLEKLQQIEPVIEKSALYMQCKEMIEKEYEKLRNILQTVSIRIALGGEVEDVNFISRVKDKTVDVLKSQPMVYKMGIILRAVHLKSRLVFKKFL